METETTKTQSFEWTTAKGSKITLTVETTETPEIAYADGYNCPTGKTIRTRSIAVTVNGTQLVDAGFWQGHIEGRLDGQRAGVLLPDDVKDAIFGTQAQRDAKAKAYADKLVREREADAKRDAERKAIYRAMDAREDR